MCMMTVKQDPKFAQCLLLSFPYSPYYLEKVKKLDKRRYIPDTKEWRIQKCEIKKLMDMVGSYNVQFVDTRLQRTLFPEQDHEKEIREYKEKLKTMKPSVPFNFKTSPLPHQIEAFNYGMERTRFLIADEMGLGKTMESLNIAVAKKQEKGYSKCLIVCGDNSTKYNWMNEIHKHTNEEAVVFDQSGKEKKLKAIREWEYSDIYFGIINIESLRCNEIPTSCMRSFLNGNIGPSSIPANPITEELSRIADITIADEIHKMKNGTSKQGMALQTLQTECRIGLSGTPLTNHVEDLWNILKWLGGTRSNYWEFRNQYCILGGYKDKEVIGHKNLEYLSENLQHYMLRRTKEQVLNLPDKIYKTEYVELAKDTRQLYETVKTGIVEKLCADMQIHRITIQNALTRMLRLRQITEGINAIDRNTIEIMKKNPKLERVKELLSEITANGKKAILFTCWETTASLFRDELAGYNPAYVVGKVKPEDRQKEVDRFQNDPECKIAIGTIGAMGTGLTMTAAEYVIFIDKYWNQTDNSQAEDRAHRIGSKNTVTIISLVAKDTIDEKIEKMLDAKESVFSYVVDEERLDDIV